MTARARFSGILVVAALAALVGACGGGGGGDAVHGGVPPDSGRCNAIADDDGDGINNDLEGCTGMPPRDSDGDGTPNYLDTDSDGDGVPDRYEDRDGNGLIGDCTTSCVMQAMCPAGYTCALPADGASIGYCVAFACMDGETSPLVGDSDGDGTNDAQEGTFICNPGTETNPNGLKMFKTVDSVGAISYATPNWKVALELDALDGPVVVTNPTMLDSAYVFDLTDPAAAVAGFVVSRPVKVTESDAFVAAQLAAARLDALPNSNTTLRASGTRNTSLDGYDSVFSTTVVFTSNGASDAVAVRERAVAAMLDRTPADVQLPPAGWTPAADTQFVVSFQSLHRADANQMLFMGAVARLSDFDDPMRATGFHVDDMANGTALTHSGNGDTVECEQFLVAQTPKADIIWVVDESGSMSDDRADVAANATSFFNKATTAGLDFRMGVTDMNDATGGRFASRMAGSSTGDRWLLPTDLATFMTNMNDPSGPDPDDCCDEHGLTQGRAAVNRHVPRDDADAAKVRTDAQLVVIYVTDEHADEIEDAGILDEVNDVATASERMQITTTTQQYLMNLETNDAIAHAIGVPETMPDCSGGGGEIAYGYLDLVSPLGGQFGSICQTDLGSTLDAIIDDIIGAASPIVLGYVPVSLTIAVARDGVQVPRSRSMGWDFRASSNAIIFNNMPFNPAIPSEVVVSYRRWSEQVPIE